MSWPVGTSGTMGSGEPGLLSSRDITRALWLGYWALDTNTDHLLWRPTPAEAGALVTFGSQCFGDENKSTQSQRGDMSYSRLSLTGGGDGECWVWKFS